MYERGSRPERLRGLEAGMAEGPLPRLRGFDRSAVRHKGRVSFFQDRSRGRGRTGRKPGKGCGKGLLLIGGVLASGLMLLAGAEPAPAATAAPAVVESAAPEPARSAAAPEPEKRWFSDEEAAMVARVLWREARGVPSDTEVACVAWTIVNRVDAGLAESVHAAVTAPEQYAWDPDAPTEERLLDIARDVLTRWEREKNGAEPDGRVLPPEYLWFQGDGAHNWFRDQYRSGNVWDYSLPTPYES